MFQYIGTHPYLLSLIDNMKNKKIKEKDLITNEAEDNPICNINGWWKAKVPEDADEKIDYGSKLIVVKSILEECEEIGDKVMDGTVSPEYRSVLCDLFNDRENKKIRLLLMIRWRKRCTNAQLPNWQLPTEWLTNIKSRGITKSMDLQELYSCRPRAQGERPTPNVPEDQILAKLILKLPNIFKYHEHQALLANRPEDNLNEQELNAAWDEFKKMKDAKKNPPQPTTVPLQIPDINGPTFSMAYNLTRANQPSNKDVQPTTTTQKRSRLPVFATEKWFTC
ncbi:hypothetical protein NQ317_007225 [Molorchus minor]|uniref:Uncharacterized protein n=1 Tax=Molorchus minor TaxID=1323400 RepID=A0ABQ9IZW5_9CUCU|nr:hypothetical protein NQ317_007225 [Molorchus minor]